MSSTPMVSIMGVHIADMLIGITPKKKEELPWKCSFSLRGGKEAGSVFMYALMIRIYNVGFGLLRCRDKYSPCDRGNEKSYERFEGTVGRVSGLAYR